MKVSELIERLSTMNPDARVCTMPRNAISRTPYPTESEGFDGGWGYVLTLQYSGGREAKEQGKSFPVVWL